MSELQGKLTDLKWKSSLVFELKDLMSNHLEREVKFKSIDFKRKILLLFHSLLWNPKGEKWLMKNLKRCVLNFRVRIQNWNEWTSKSQKNIDFRLRTLWKNLELLRSKWKPTLQCSQPKEAKLLDLKRNWMVLLYLINIISLQDNLHMILWAPLKL